VLSLNHKISAENYTEMSFIIRVPLSLAVTKLRRLVASHQELILKQCFTHVKRPPEEGSVYRKACIYSKSYRCARFQVFAAVQQSSLPFWVMTPRHKVISSRKHRPLKMSTLLRMDTSRTDYAMTRPGTPEEGRPPSSLHACTGYSK
jgi:hypothetical protein